jgi:tricorn protease
MPVGSQTESLLRHIDWIKANQRKVEQLSEGRLAYVYIPDTELDGFISFNRDYFAQTDKQGAILDERFNQGGQLADYMVEVMRRERLSYRASRYGDAEHTPSAAIPGPKVMLINELAASGGDVLPRYFRYEKLGPLVGKRTGGATSGPLTPPSLMDGAEIDIPGGRFYSPQGKWDLENVGVEPDFVVEQDPKRVSEGHDPQLEKAVQLALAELAAHPSAREPARPPYPNYQLSR